MRRVHVHLSYKKLLENLDIVREKRLDLEIYFDSITLDNIVSNDIQKLKETLDWNPHLTFHGPYMDMSPGGVDERVRRVTVIRFLHLVGIARILRPRILVFHPGYDKWRFHGHQDLWLENSLKTWRLILEDAKDIGASIAIENVFEEDPSTLESLIKRMDSTKFGICFDTGHFHLFSKKPLKEWIDRLGSHLLEVHIHDNNGIEDEHLAIGDGKFDFNSLFKLLNNLPHKPLLIIEAHGKEATEKSIERIKRYL
jgi:sugar phosphate isomerase/epimerase